MIGCSRGCPGILGPGQGPSSIPEGERVGPHLSLGCRWASVLSEWHSQGPPPLHGLLHPQPKCIPKAVPTQAAPPAGWLRAACPLQQRAASAFSHSCCLPFCSFVHHLTMGGGRVGKEGEGQGCCCWALSQDLSSAWDAGATSSPLARSSLPALGPLSLSLIIKT